MASFVGFEPETDRIVSSVKHDGVSGVDDAMLATLNERIRGDIGSMPMTDRVVSEWMQANDDSATAGVEALFSVMSNVNIGDLDVVFRDATILKALKSQRYAHFEVPLQLPDDSPLHKIPGLDIGKMDTAPGSRDMLRLVRTLRTTMLQWNVMATMAQRNAPNKNAVDAYSECHKAYRGMAASALGLSRVAADRDRFPDDEFIRGWVKKVLRWIHAFWTQFERIHASSSRHTITMAEKDYELLRTHGVTPVDGGWQWFSSSVVVSVVHKAGEYPRIPESKYFGLADYVYTHQRDDFAAGTEITVDWKIHSVIRDGDTRIIRFELTRDFTPALGAANYHLENAIIGLGTEEPDPDEILAGALTDVIDEWPKEVDLSTETPDRIRRAEMQMGREREKVLSDMRAAVAANQITRLQRMARSRAIDVPKDLIDFVKTGDRDKFDFNDVKDQVYELKTKIDGAGKLGAREKLKNFLFAVLWVDPITPDTVHATKMRILMRREEKVQFIMACVRWLLDVMLRLFLVFLTSPYRYHVVYPAEWAHIPGRMIGFYQLGAEQRAAMEDFMWTHAVRDGKFYYYEPNFTRLFNTYGHDGYTIVNKAVTYDDVYTKLYENSVICSGNVPFTYTTNRIWEASSGRSTQFWCFDPHKNARDEMMTAVAWGIVHMGTLGYNVVASAAGSNLGQQVIWAGLAHIFNRFRRPQRRQGLLRLQEHVVDVDAKERYLRK